MALPFTDSFTGGAAVLPNPPWTQAAIPSVVATLNRDGSGNAKASAVDATNDVMAYDNSNTYGDNQYVFVTVVSGLSAANNYATVLVRCSGTGASFKGYAFFTDGTTGSSHTGIAKWTSGSSAELLAIATTVANGAVIMLVVTTVGGNAVLKAFKNGVLVGTVTDSTSPIASGAVGASVYNSSANTVTLDTFEGGNIGGGGGSYTDQPRTDMAQQQRAA